MAIDYNVFYFKRGGAYAAEVVVKKSAYLLPIDKRPGRPAGNSRIHGDASHEVQRKVIDAIIGAAQAQKFTVRRTAMLLAMAGIESGFNPDAAAGTTSACGIGQFVKRTGEFYGLTPETRFEIGPSVKALIAYFKENERTAKKKKKPDYWVYKYHHDGPKHERGGAKLADKVFLPLVEKYEQALTAGHVVDIIDPHGQPIMDAYIKVGQNGKEAVLKTDEKGRLPPFLANPDLGSVNVSIKKSDDTFKHLGELPIKKHSTAWTIVAPKDRASIKTHLHEPANDGCPPGSDTHKVQSGETVSLIARYHGTTYQQICELNGIEKPYTIYPGQILKLPHKTSSHRERDASSTDEQHAASMPPPASASTDAAASASQATHVPAARTQRDAAQPRAAGQHATHASTVPGPTAPPREQPAPVPEPPPGRPTVSEQRDQQSKHPVANVVASSASDNMSATIAYALKHRESGSISRCLKYVKRALFATKMIKPYDACELAKDYGPYLEKNGFKNILVTRPGTNLANAPIGAIIVYRPIEMQVFQGKAIAGHIEIKTEVGYVSDYLSEGPTYSTNPITMISPVGKKKPVSYKVIGIYIKE